ncbi:hypothetical protein ACN42_g10318 [Penicillium freii]|uniref:Uncharacterized protein n=1 Tax=Penicillium freii TaxID=48697 RepID=A0A101MAJ7_PENFR|nr:hypothetical protein ACN42_g10318 [Penicillium freii]
MSKLIFFNRATCLTQTVSSHSVDFRQPYRVAGRVHESASHVREKIAEQLQPGDMKATSRRSSDTPDNIWQFGQGGAREERDYGLERDRPLLQSAQETVAKALGGGNRG